MERPRISPDRFREVFSCLPTGVTVITAYAPETLIGMAANSVTSVSLDPPLVLVCPAKSSETWPGIRRAGSFCINVMAGHHEEVTRQFARRDCDRFAGVSVHERTAGPGLDDAVAWIDCRLSAEHEAGDHTIVVAEVLGLDVSVERDALVFYRGRYGVFGNSGQSGVGEVSGAK